MPARLVTIPISHFCEKARWALHRAGVRYTEQPHLQLIHIAAARRAGGGTTVPVFVADDGEVIADSTDILRWADRRLAAPERLYPDGEMGDAAAALEDVFDEGLGPDSRLWVYRATLPIVARLRPWAEAGLPGWEKLAFHGAGPLVNIGISRALGVNDATAAVALENVQRVFDDVAARLADGRPFLLGDRFTAADLTFGALSAAMLLPGGYGSPLPPPEALPAAAARDVRRLRAHPAGAFARRLYREERWARRAAS
ncbi:MAG TPA: glutathione S-transferase family protein [Solirubrobacteraceae bacterium]|nr:glutathione S-transferase family protein [Solirubrobacteraceae bacterium]